MVCMVSPGCASKLVMRTTEPPAMTSTFIVSVHPFVLFPRHSPERDFMRSKRSEAGEALRLTVARNARAIRNRDMSGPPHSEWEDPGKTLGATRWPYEAR